MKSWTLAALSNALVQVGPGVGFAPLFVPSQIWVPPENVVTLWPRVLTDPSKIVFFAPSIRKLTVVGGFGLFAANTEESKAATSVRENKWRNILKSWLNYFSNLESDEWIFFTRVLAFLCAREPNKVQTKIDTSVLVRVGVMRDFTGASNVACHSLLVEAIINSRVGMVVQFFIPMIGFCCGSSMSHVTHGDSPWWINLASVTNQRNFLCYKKQSECWPKVV